MTLRKVNNNILESLDQGSVSVLLMFNMSVAFDTIDHQTLLQPLEQHFGITGTPLAWMTSYLRDLFQTACVDGEQSLPALMEYGLPQVSVLGLKNYVLHTKPLGDVIWRHALEHHLYADETQLCLSFKPKDAMMRIDNCLIEIET